MVEPRIVRLEQAELHPLHGEGRIRRLIYPGTVGSAKIFVGIAEVAPGEAPHVLSSAWSRDSRFSRTRLYGRFRGILFCRRR